VRTAAYLYPWDVDGDGAAAVRAGGATELRLYHAGLAAPSDLSAIRELSHAESVSG
jgi:hypothetical protein